MHPRRLSLVTSLAAALLVAGSSSSARADGTGDAWHTVDRIGAEATSPGGSSDGVKTPRRSRPSPCKYEVLPPDDQENAEHLWRMGWSDTEKVEGSPGRWLRKICGQDETSAGTATVIWVPEKADPEVLAERALRDAELPVPALATSPAADEPQVVNLATWLAVDPAVWTPASVSATAGAITVTTSAEPKEVVWDLGNGDSVVCDGPGTRYDPGRPAAEQQPDCSYTYRRPGRYQVTATMVWHVRWDAVGFPGGGDLGLSRRSTTTTFDVVEVQAVNRPPRQGD